MKQLYLNLYGEEDEYKGRDKIDYFYLDYIEFKKYIEIRIIDYEKEYKGRPILISRYASSLDFLKLIFEQYSSKRYNIYVGSNSRDKPERKDESIDYRRTFYFDIEAEGKKPSLTDKFYRKKLLITVLYLRDEFKKIGLKINVVKESGRGMHVGFKIKPLRRLDYDRKFINWYKTTKTKLLLNRPFEDIKFSDSMFNISRIESAPGTRHNKYEEAPLRRVLYLSSHENDIEEILNKVEVPERKKINANTSYSEYYDDKTIFNSPEFQLLINFDDLPEGSLHTHIITQIKILVRDNNIDMDLVSDKLQELGYDEVMDIPDQEDYKRNPMIYNYWCLSNYEYCYDNDIKLITSCYKNKSNGLHFSYSKKDPGIKPKYDKIDNYKDMLYYIKLYNQLTLEDNNMGGFVIYKEQLIKNIKELCTNQKLWKYVIESNGNYFDYICYYSYPKNKAHGTNG